MFPRVLTTATLIVLLAAPAMADRKTTQQCGNQFDQCQTECSVDHKNEPSTRAPCVARCSGLYAACEASVAYDKAKPWVGEQVKKTEKFFEELIKKLDDKAVPPPQTKTKSNSI